MQPLRSGSKGKHQFTACKNYRGPLHTVLNTLGISSPLCVRDLPVVSRNFSSWVSCHWSANCFPGRSDCRFILLADSPVCFPDREYARLISPTASLGRIPMEHVPSYCQQFLCPTLDKELTIALAVVNRLNGICITFGS